MCHKGKLWPHVRNVFFLSFFLTQRYFFHCFLDREESKVRKTSDVKEKHWLVASHTHPDHGPNLQPRHVPWLGIEPATFGYSYWWHTNQLSHTGQGEKSLQNWTAWWCFGGQCCLFPCRNKLPDKVTMAEKNLILAWKKHMRSWWWKQSISQNLQSLYCNLLFISGHTQWRDHLIRTGTCGGVWSDVSSGKITTQSWLPASSVLCLTFLLTHPWSSAKVSEGPISERRVCRICALEIIYTKLWRCSWGIRLNWEHLAPFEQSNFLPRTIMQINRNSQSFSLCSTQSFISMHVYVYMFVCMCVVFPAPLPWKVEWGYYFSILCNLGGILEPSLVCANMLGNQTPILGIQL